MFHRRKQIPHLFRKALILFCIARLLLKLIYLKKIFFLVLWVFIAVCGLSLVAASRGYSLVGICRPLIAEAPLVVAPRM